MDENIGLSIIASIIGLAAIDSINPVEFLAGIFLFTIKKPLSRFFPFTIGIFIFHFFTGYVFYYAFNFILGLKVFDYPVFDRSVELIGGIFLIILGFRIKKHNKSTIKRIIDPKPLYTFLLGMGITISAIPTSVAYYSAIGIIADNKLSFSDLSFFLLLYNLIFVFPLFVFLAIYLFFRKHSEKIFEKARSFIVIRLNKILRVIFILVGLLLVINFIFYILSR